MAASQSLNVSSDAQMLANYAFIKTLAQFVDQLAHQLTTIWAKEQDVREPEHFQVATPSFGIFFNFSLTQTLSGSYPIVWDFFLIFWDFL